MSLEHILKTEQLLPKHRKAIIHLILVSNHIMEKLTEELKVFDTSLQQFNVLRILRGQKGKPANLYTIQERMIHKMSNTTRLVDKLILKGYVKRAVCESNRRKVEILITDKGLDALKEMDKAIHACEKELTAQLNPQELENLNNLLDKFLVTL
ncbi:MarR family winged helix-turn-helix transcriptional regulator [Ascidiimonas aurantiaca]|uniref:MarR family winged helix-turn-helix transcriptional regulator n=1 Tax=Ascidiimonas aurantiaca TaxID=1685432 RepID=UPI0030EBF400